jgi:hypothetical protein
MINAIVVTRAEQYIIDGKLYFKCNENIQLFSMNIENNSKEDLVKLSKYIGLKNSSTFKKEELVNALRLYIIFEN